MHVHHAITEVSQLFSESKDKYYNKLSMKFNNPKTSSKTYWSIFKTFYNGRKIPIIRPILKEGKLESHFKIKGNYFNSFFASQCTPLVNSTPPDKITSTLQLELLQLSLSIMIFLQLSDL